MLTTQAAGPDNVLGQVLMECSDQLTRVLTDIYNISEVEDTTADRCFLSFKVLVVSSKFEGKPLLQRHRLVNNCLAEELKEIHAFEQKTLTPEQWEKEKQK
ncbi:bolA-like protein 2 [Protopterus annectens]|uniref:bolA-like protein 2 n=1 Tax=Protopterus annectens TaxID=7888 RepID=UPI001CFB2355|nr:bolA-like protein 2 [Protopterus annectens]